MPTGIYKHKPMSEATKEKIRQIRQLRPIKYWLGKKRPKFSKKVRKKMSQSQILLNKKRGEKKHPSWKGSKVGYRALHDWVYKHLGAPDICENCGKKGLRGHFGHWANKTGKYERKLKDWIRLCGKCHKIMDMYRLKNYGKKRNPT